MERPLALIAAAAGAADLLRGAAVAVVTLVIVVTVLVLVGFVVLFRRRGDRGIRDSGGPDSGTLGRQAGSILVRLDDALREADDELGYAIAQFGPDAARPYADALAGARTKVAEAFRLKQALDDATPDSDQQRRAWTLQIIALCTQAQETLTGQDAAFAQLRSLEVNAASTLAGLRSRIAASMQCVESARTTLAGLAKGYVATTFAQVSQHPDDAAKLLDQATQLADAAEPGISQAGVSDVASTLLKASRSAQDADQLLDTVERTARDLKAADAALDTLRTKTTADLVEARTERDQAPDAETGRAIIDAIAGIESILAEKTAGPSDPVTELDRLGDAVSALDTALASARNQAQRLEHARAAYAGTLVSVKSQLTAARDYIGRYGGGVDARTRLAEAERQLTIAEAEADPVEALDTVRRAVTLARDADALARYDTSGGR